MIEQPVSLPTLILRTIGAIVAAAAGVVLGGLLFILVRFFTTMAGDAMPHWKRGTPHAITLCVLALIAATGPFGVLREPRSSSNSKIIAAVMEVVLLLLVVGTLCGIMNLGGDVHGYITPAGGG